MLREWLPMQGAYLRNLYAMHAEPSVGPNDSFACMGCSGGGGTWKCTSCFGQPIYCANCCRSLHARTPFHRVEQWNIKGFWESSWLRSLGVVIPLGHRGSACPVPDVSLGPDPDEVDEGFDMESDEHEDNTDDPLRFAERPPRVSLDYMLIVDSTGVHELQVKWCGCPNAPAPTDQLLDSGLFPASQRVPRTCFTFRVLDEFMLDNLECKVTAMSYYRKLRRITNPAFPHEVPVRCSCTFL